MGYHWRESLSEKTAAGYSAEKGAVMEDRSGNIIVTMFLAMVLAAAYVWLVAPGIVK